MIKLLIVDDSNIIRSRIERIYSASFDIEVVAKASNGKEAIYFLDEHKPDIVATDLTMPEMDGIACIDKMMAINPKIKIIVVSALSDKATGIQALAKGARGFLCKPFSDEELLEALEKLVKSKDRLNEKNKKDKKK